jgi:hypothetical protein
MILVAWLLAWTQAVAGDARPAEVQIRAANGSVAIHVQGLPLSQILDRLASATGMKVTYEGARPSSPITMNVDGISEVDAILRLTEGLGVSYLFRTDETGQRVDDLIVTAAGAGSLAAATPPSRIVEMESEEAVVEVQVPVETAEPDAAAKQAKPEPNNPHPGLPAQHFPPPVPGSNGETTVDSDSRSTPAPPGPPGMPGMPGMSGMSGMSGIPALPTFQQGVSHPR